MNKFTPHFLIVVLALLGIFIFGCSTEEQSSDIESIAEGDSDASEVPAVAGPSANVGISVPFDIAEIITQVHFSYRETVDGFEGGHLTYSVNADRTGYIQVTPFLPTDEELEEGIVGAPLFVETTMVRCGDRRLDTKVQAHIGEDGTLLLDRGAVSEVLQNRDDGVEQSWLFAQRPESSGDLVVEVELSGLVITEINETGLHFTDPDSGLGFLYSHAKWIDANEQEFDIPVRWINDHAQLLVPARLLEQSAYPAVLDPWVAPEFGTDNPIYLPARNRQSSPAIAWGGNTYFLAWEDRRFVLNNTVADLYGARVSAGGALLTPAGIVISRAANNQRNAAVAFNGLDFVVAWEDNRGGANYDIYAARVTTSGEVLEDNGILVSDAAGDQTWPSAAAASGTNTTLIAWTDARNSSLDIYGSRIDLDGNVLDQYGIAISNVSEDQNNPAVAFGASNFLVVWDDMRGSDRDIYAARVNQSGTVLDASGFVVSDAANLQYYPAATFGSGQYMVTWRDDRNGNSDIYGARVGTDGTVQDTSGIAISTAANSQQTSSVAFDGTNYFAVWDDFRNGSSYNIHGARISTAGEVLDPASITISSAVDHQYEPVVAYSGTSYFVAWHDYRLGGYPNIYGSRVNTGGSVLDPNGIALSLSANLQFYPAIGFDGTNFLLVWEDQRDGANYDIYGTRVSQNGTVLDPSGIAICTATDVQARPAVAYGGGRYLVTWSDYRNAQWDVYGSRITTAGAVSDPNGIAISTATNAQLDTDVAYGGDYFLVVWRDNRNGAYDVYGARVTGAGAVSDPSGIAINAAINDQGYPSVKYGTSSFLVVWQDMRNGNNDIFSTRVTVAGGVQSPGGLIVTNAAGDQAYPTLSWDGTNWLAVWQDARNGNTDIYGQRIGTGGGNVGSIIPISTISGNQSFPYATYDGYAFFVAWQYVNGGSTDIYGAWVASDGTVETTDEPLLNQPNYDENWPVMASAGGGKSMLLYYHFDFTPIYGANRVYGVFVSYLPTGLTCTENEECMTGFCVDGYCCDTECGADDPNDCQVCSQALGSPANGTCSILPAQTLCRDVAGDCDIAEYCDGTVGTCPDDTFVDATVECRESAGICDVAENCPGDGPACPEDAFLADTEMCREGVNDCDATEFCTGDAAECPEDLLEPDETPCEDDLFCNGADSCEAGLCVQHAGDPCGEDETCDEELDECVGGDDDTTDDDTTDDDTIDDDTIDDDIIDDDTLDDDSGDDEPNIIGPEEADIPEASSKKGDDDDDDGCCGC